MLGVDREALFIQNNDGVTDLVEATRARPRRGRGAERAHRHDLVFFTHHSTPNGRRRRREDETTFYVRGEFSHETSKEYGHDILEAIIAF